MWRESAASFSGSSLNPPPEKISTPPSARRSPDRSVPGARDPTCFPTAWTSRPTLGSFPATAHFSRGALTTVFPSARADEASGAFTTDTRITCRTPSPLRTTSSARSAHTVWSARSKSAASGHGTPPEETRATVSDVLVSLSTLIELKIGQTEADGDGEVRQEVHEHGGHVGLDHAGTLRDPDDRAGAHGGPADLGVEVGRHDPLGRRKHRPPGEGAHGGRERAQDPIHGQAPADDARRARKDLALRKPEQPRRLLADPLRRGDPAGRAHVRDLVVDEDRPERRAVEPGSADEHGGPGERVAREDGGEVRRGPVERDQRERHPRGLADLGRREVELRRADAET